MKHITRTTSIWSSAAMLAGACNAAWSQGDGPVRPVCGVSLAGRVDATLTAISAALPHVQRGKLRVLGVASCWRMTYRDQRALVRDRWKYLQVEGIEYLFELQADERERANLANRIAPQPAELRDAWHAWDSALPPIPADAKCHKLYSKNDMPLPST